MNAFKASAKKWETFSLPFCGSVTVDMYFKSKCCWAWMDRFFVLLTYGIGQICAAWLQVISIAIQLLRICFVFNFIVRRHNVIAAKPFRWHMVLLCLVPLWVYLQFMEYPCDNSYPKQLVPRTIHTQDNAYPGQPDSTLLFRDAYMHPSSTLMTSSNGNIFRVTGHLCWEFSGPRWIPRTKASDAELWCFLWSASDQAVE